MYYSLKGWSNFEAFKVFVQVFFGRILLQSFTNKILVLFCFHGKTQKYLNAFKMVHICV